jgi:putative Mg2+ transporter-C (MgtC) family protein
MELNEAALYGFFDADLVSRLAAAAVLGLLLGLDREIRGHAAGLRTHGIVCVAAATMTVSIIALYHQMEGARMDPLRIYEAAGAFVGILGAGLVVFSKGEVKNLTTAAHLWLAAAIGVACGAGQWPLVLYGTLAALLLMTAMRTLETHWFGGPQDE